MGLDNLTHMHQFPEKAGCSGRGDPYHMVTGFRRSQMMADRTDPANPWCNLNHFKERSAFREFLKTSPFVDMEKGPVNLSFVVEVYGHLGVTLDSRDGLYGDLLHVEILL